MCKAGLRRGGILSLTLFNIYIDDVLQQSNKNTKGLYMGGKNMQRVKLNACAFVDNLIIAAGNERDMPKNLNV